MIDFKQVILVDKLKDKCGCDIRMAKAALEYSENDMETAIAYIKAKSIAVATPDLTFDERVEYFKYKAVKEMASNYPDGVTDRDIDKHFGSEDDNKLPMQMHRIHYRDKDGMLYKEVQFFKTARGLAAYVARLEEAGYKVEKTERMSNLDNFKRKETKEQSDEH